MPITADYHLHSSFSGDCEAPMEQMVQSALEKGLKKICFTEHQDFDFPVTPHTPAGIFELNTDSYLYDIIRLKEKYEGRLEIFFGVELGVQTHIFKDLARYSKAYDFDFIIASSHLCHKKDPFFPAFYQDRSEDEAYLEYFTAISENIRKFQNFDVYGHLDYVVRYGPARDSKYSYEKYQDILDEILTLLIEREKGLEINTGGLKCGLREPNPCSGILKRYRELGGEIITAGSDAHTPESAAYEFEQAAEILKACGFKYYTSFEHRMPQFHKL